MRVLLALCGAVLLAGCQTSTDVGEGPLVMSQPVVAGYEYFKGLGNPGYFAVPPDGSTYGYSYCKDFNCRGNSPSVAVNACNRSRPVKDCRLYAYGDKVLWQFPAEWTPPEDFTFQQAAETLPEVPLEGTLPGSGRPVSGTLFLKPDLGYGAFIIADLPIRGDCLGTLRRTHENGGLWEADCANEEAVVGVFSLDTENGMLRGFATDQNGNQLHYFAKLPTQI